MRLTTTFERLRAAGACESRYRLLRKALSGIKDEDPIDLLLILETNGLDDALWALSATVENCDRAARLMAADFAEAVLPIWQEYSQDKRPELAIAASRDFANGRISAAALAAAGAAALAAAWGAAGAAARVAAGAAALAARDAARAARGAAWAARAARDAAGEKQREIFVSYLQPESVGI